MKQKLHESFVFTVILIMLLFSCKKDFGDGFESEIDQINEAKEWYDNHMTGSLVLKPHSSKGSEAKSRPEWVAAKLKKQKASTTVEVPLSTFGLFGVAPSKTIESFQETGDSRLIQSTTKLIILKDELKDSTFGFLMTIVPDKDFVLANNFQVRKFSYLDWQKDFSGYILYHNLDGSYSNGWKLLDGEISKTVIENEFSDSKAKMELNSQSSLLVVDCFNFFVTYWERDCTDWFQDYGDYIIYTGTTCDAPYTVTEYLYTECNFIEDPGGSGGGGGFSPPSTIYNPIYDPPCPGDPVKNLSIASTSNGAPITGMYGCNRVSYDTINWCAPDLIFHHGVDVAAPLNSPVFAMFSGTVIALVKTVPVNQYGSSGALGNFVMIRHTYSDNSTLDITYGHLNSVSVTLNTIVTTGQLIGYSGKTGNAYNVANPHVHIKAQRNGVTINPAPLFGSSVSNDGTTVSPCSLEVKSKF